VGLWGQHDYWLRLVLTVHGNGSRFTVQAEVQNIRGSRSQVRVNQRVRLSRASGLNVVLGVMIVGQVPANWKALD